jgi:hypothetical protein
MFYDADGNMLCVTTHSQCSISAARAAIPGPDRHGGVAAGTNNVSFGYMPKHVRGSMVSGGAMLYYLTNPAAGVSTNSLPAQVRPGTPISAPTATSSRSSGPARPRLKRLDAGGSKRRSRRNLSVSWEPSPGSSNVQENSLRQGISEGNFEEARKSHGPHPGHLSSNSHHGFRHRSSPARAI